MEIELIFKSKTREDNLIETHYNNYEFEIVCINEETQQARTLIGKGRAILYLTQRATAYNDLQLFLFSFAECGQLDIYGELFEMEEFYLKDRYCDPIFQNTENTNILVLDRIQLLPEYRKRGIFKTVINLIRNYFYGCYGLEIAIARPEQYKIYTYKTEKEKQWDNMMKYEDMEKDDKKIKVSLHKFLKKNKFCKVRNSDIYYHIFKKTDLVRKVE